jgi:hypothetical protein
MHHWATLVRWPCSPLSRNSQAISCLFVGWAKPTNVWGSQLGTPHVPPSNSLNVWVDWLYFETWLPTPPP